MLDSHSFVVDSESSLVRLDKVLLDLLINHDLSRARVQKLIKSKQVKVNQEVIVKVSYQVQAEDYIEVSLATLEVRKELKPYDTEYQIVYEDQSLIVVDKPSGLTVHPGAGNPDRTLANALVGHLGYAPLMVHRLDKHTSGLMVVAKTESAQRKLIKQFEDRSISRTYLALCLATPRSNRLLQEEKTGEVETLMGRDPRNRVKIAVLESGGKLAKTSWKVLANYPYALLVELKLQTGRTHQIRVHLDHLKSPLIGDPIYGDFSLLPNSLALVHQSLGRQFLHATKLSFIHPETKEQVSFESELPEELVTSLKAFKEYI